MVHSSKTNKELQSKIVQKEQELEYDKNKLKKIPLLVKIQLNVGPILLIVLLPLCLHLYDRTGEYSNLLFACIAGGFVWLIFSCLKMKKRYVDTIYYNEVLAEISDIEDELIFLRRDLELHKQLDAQKYRQKPKKSASATHPKTSKRKMQVPPVVEELAPAQVEEEVYIEDFDTIDEEAGCDLYEDDDEYEARMQRAKEEDYWEEVLLEEEAAADRQRWEDEEKERQRRDDEEQEIWYWNYGPGRHLDEDEMAENPDDYY